VSEAESLVTGFLGSAVRVATPLLLAATGETISERAGVINLGLEGMMLAGALAATLGATTTGGGPWAGVALAIMVGMALATVFALLTVGARTDQVIAGTALTLAAVGLTGTVYRRVYGAAGAGLDVPTLGPIGVPGLERIPLIGPSFFDQPVPTYIALVALPIVWWVLFRTRMGLALRATGETAALARSAGVRTRLIRSGATIVGGGFAGLAGATLVLAQVGSFAEKMTAGRGYIAIAIVVLGRWHPVGVGAAALLFGAASALQFVFQTLGLRVPYQLFLMLPYAVALLALGGAVGRVRAPADLGRP
jgi:general nucleoside transport system permease protein